ncbi:MAG TPA: nicotinate-nucleotide--dimethylbenzimidazole phosphoribosyltransferase [Acidimicrobiales bacterium]|nr:nicotinate-nucleotide--dimethylbenzimidazole phosphoribosyltransferase [Acidimicrobiales bacterium]
MANLRPLNHAAAVEAAALSDRLTKPRYALGRLETLGAQLAGIAGVSPPPVPAPAAVAVFAADHGVVAEGVTPWPSEVTAQMVANFCAGGAAISVLARHSGTRVLVVDVGVASTLPNDLPPDSFVAAKVRPGTGNIAIQPAMTVDEARAAMDVGADTAARLVVEGAACLATGEMGIGNTTPSAALVAALCGRRPAEVTGRGTGIDDPMLAHKIAVVEQAVSRIPDHAEALDVLASVGGLEIAALAGFIVGGAAARVPVVIDGLIALAAALVANALAPDVRGYLIAGHRSTEPGATAALTYLGLEPVLDLELRLGEGTGACLAVPVVQASAHILREMATFDAAGVTDKDQ